MQKQFTLALGDPIGPVDPIWTFGANTCHAPLWFRDDLFRHLAVARDRLGFRHVRAHGTIGDGMRTVSGGGAFCFDRVLDGLDRLLDLGFTPYLELSHMPAALAAGDNHITHYRFRSDPPADWQRWRAFVEAFGHALARRYGAETLRGWWFEVWNEPDLAFWEGGQRGYFRLYDLAAAALKSIDDGLRVGGPATARTRWVGDFLEHVSRPTTDDNRSGLRCDFLATHAYPSDMEFLDAAEGDVELQSSNIMRQLFAAARATVNRYSEDLPLFCGEWNSSAGPLATNHDECNNAAFIAKTMAELSDGTCQGQLFWNLSDIYEECGFHHEPFHGGYGLFTVNDLPKAAFHAFALLKQHTGDRLQFQLEGQPAPGIGGLATRHGGTTRLLLWNYIEPGTEGNDAHLQLANVLDAGTAEVVSILPGEGSAYEAWVESGSPTFANRDLLDTLDRASQPRIRELRPSGEVLGIPAGTLHQITVTQ